jgi:hypothetical protein
MEEKRKLRDGYTVRNGKVTFYDYSALQKMSVGKHARVDEEKVLEYEAMCETFRKTFMDVGWLRLHTPVEQYQERSGTNFLFVPQEHRARVAGLIKGGTMIKLSKPRTFRILETKEDISFDQIIGNGELFDLGKTRQQYRMEYGSGAITKEEWKKRATTLQQWGKTKFHIDSFEIPGMFVEEE